MKSTLQTINHLPYAIVALAILAVQSSIAFGQQQAPGVARFGTSSLSVTSTRHHEIDEKSIPIDGGKITFGGVPNFVLSPRKAVVSHTFRIVNSSPNPYGLSFSKTGTDQGDFGITGCAILPSKSSCDLTVTYLHSNGARTSSAQLRITATGPGPAAAVFTLPAMNLQGSNDGLIDHARGPGALGASLPIEFTPTTVFDSVAGDSSVSQTVTITNLSANAYTISSTTLAGLDATDFKITKCDGTRLDRTSPQCSVTVTYSPTSAKSSIASLAVTLTPEIAADPVGTATVLLDGHSHSSCTGTPGYAVFLAHPIAPLNHKGIDDTTINCYYNTKSNLAFLTQASYQYNPSGSANTISGDLASVQFIGGVQLTIIGTVTASSCSSATSTSSAPTNTACSGAANTTTSVSQPSLEQDIQSLTQGGDFGIKILWPFLNYQVSRLQINSMVVPKVGFTVNGLSPTATATNATDVNAFIANETYAQLDGIPAHNGGDSPASLFFDYRWGLEHVAPAFATTAMLPHSNFLLQQISAGIVIGGAIRISGERYFGPSQVFIDSAGKPASANNFANWQLRVQFSPSSISSH